MSQSAVARMRRQTRRAVRSTGIRAQEPLSNEFILDTNNGNAVWFAEDVRYPKEVGAGGVVDVAVDMVNRRQFITPLHPDQCVSGFFNGLKSEITITPDWDANEFTATNCLALDEGTIARETIAQDFPAPSEPGTYTLSVEIRGANSNEGGIESYEIVVPDPDSGDDPDQRPGAGDGDDSPDDDGDDGDDGDEPLLTQTTLLGLAAVVTGIAALALS